MEFQSKSSRFLPLISIAFVTSILAACGSADYDSPPAEATSLSKDTSGDNLLNLQGDWLTWSGQSSGITSSGDQLTIPAPTGDNNMVVGVRRYDQVLTAGAQYTVTVTASDSNASALVFLLDSSGNNVAVTDADTGVSSQWASANAADSLRFVAPSGVNGFYVQIQGGWQASNSTQLSAEMRYSGSDGGNGAGGGGDSGGGDSGNGTNLILNGGFEDGLITPWESWGGFTNASGNAQSGSRSAQIASNSGGGTFIEIDGGKTYDWSVWGRGGGGGGSVQMLYRFYDDAWNPITEMQLVDGFDSTWGQRGGQVQAPANAGAFMLGVWNSSGTIAWIDNAQLVESGDGGGTGDGGDGGDDGGGGNNGNTDYRPAGYETLILNDEFDGSSLDRSKWCTRLVYGGGPFLQVPDAECTKFSGQGYADFANEAENQRFRDFNTNGEALHDASNGTMKLRVTNTGVNFFQRFEAAALRSKTVFKPDPSKSYYVTARVALPDILGIWPAFYLNPSLEPNGFGQWPPEIDIFEAPINGSGGENPFTLIQHAQVQGAQTDSGNSEWTYAAPGFNTTWGYWTSNDYLRERWIEIGAEWTSTGVCYFVDGFKTGCENYRWVTNDGSPGNPATLVMFVAVGGPWAGANGIDDAAFPTAMEVDYIRVYEK